MVTKQVVGTTIGEYEIRAQLGEGGMATVYRAHQPMLGRDVALKILSRVLADEPGFMQRFANEARTLARLDHPNILPVYDFGTFGDLAYIVSPLVGNGTLRDRMDEGPIDRDTALRYLAQIAAALQHAHAAGVTHRDLKPANVLLHPDGRLLLADFGLARSPDQESLTMSGFAVGTPGYMAPEQAMGADVDQRTDVYALAVIAFEILTGGLPYSGDRAALVQATVQAPIPLASERNPALPASVDDVFREALAKDRAFRTTSAQGFVDQLTAALKGAPASAAAPSAPAPAAGGAGAPSSNPGAAGSDTNTTVAPLTGIELWAARMSAIGAAPSDPTWPAITPTPPPRTPAPAPTQEMAAVGDRTPHDILAERGIGPVEPVSRVLLDAHFSNAFHAATHVAGDHWSDLVTTSGLPYLLADPPDGDERTVPIHQLAQLNEAFEVTFGAQGAQQQRRWGNVTMQVEIERTPALKAQRRRLRLMPPGHHRRIRALLTSYCSRQDAVRGEHCAAWTQVSDGEFWVAMFGNPYVFGKQKAQPSCGAIVGQLETLLRWIGLANDWLVDEVECGCVTAGPDCIFAVRAAAE